GSFLNQCSSPSGKRAMPPTSNWVTGDRVSQVIDTLDEKDPRPLRGGCLERRRAVCEVLRTRTKSSHGGSSKMLTGGISCAVGSGTVGWDCYAPGSIIPLVIRKLIL